MTDQLFLKQIQNRIAEISVGPSSLRNQGKSGILKLSRTYFKGINLRLFFLSLRSERAYNNFLDKHTQLLKDQYKLRKDQGWGTARKALNLFFRDVIYNKYLTDYYLKATSNKQFHQMVGLLEVPLDKDVSSELRVDYKKHFNESLPSWYGVKYLKQEESLYFQKAALDVAEHKNISRVHLDLEYWRKNRGA